MPSCTYRFSAHFFSLFSPLTSHSYTPNKNGQTFFLKLPPVLIPLLNTSPLISSMLILGVSSAPNHSFQVFSSTGCPGFLDVLGVGKFIVECNSSDTANDELSSSRFGVSEGCKAVPSSAQIPRPLLP